MRIANSVAQGKVKTINGRSDVALNAAMDLMARGVPVRVDATNVAEYLSRHNHGPGSAEPPALEGAMPPWRTSWIEAETPWDGAFKACAALVQDNGPDSGATPGTRIIGAHVFVWDLFEGPIGIEGIVVWEIDEAGDLAGRPRTIASDAFATYEFLGASREDHVEFKGMVIPAMTFQFANCRNVEAVEVLPTRQQRRWARRKGEPAYKHYVLQIDPATQRKVYAKGDPIPTHKRLHICRGHFATYTEAAPLFGKLTGRFWIPAHVRGKSDSGVVVKDYAVLATSS